MRFALCDRRVRDTDELCFLREFGKRFRSCITHTNLHPRNECCDNIRNWTLVRNKCLDTFGNSFSSMREIALSPGGALYDGSRAHAAILFQFLAILFNDLARAL